MDAASPLIKTAVALASVAYLDAKHGITNDLRLGRATSRAGWK